MGVGTAIAPGPTPVMSRPHRQNSVSGPIDTGPIPSGTCPLTMTLAMHRRSAAGRAIERRRLSRP
jgi:hypothetical protein